MHQVASLLGKAVGYIVFKFWFAAGFVDAMYAAHFGKRK